jgi:DHA1 family inner membrane transport protein
MNAPLSTERSDTAAGSSRLALLALSVAAFAIGTTEFVIMGCCPKWPRTCT